MERNHGTGILLAFAGMLLALYLTSDATMNRPAPAFELSDVYGGRITLDSYRGHPVLLAFWASSCGICRHELPLLSDMSSELNGKGLDILAINVGSTDEARNYLGSNHIHLRSATDPEGAVAQAYRVGGIPKLVLVSSDGKIRRTRIGAASPDTLRSWADSVTAAR
jgi:peroxiredoxin